MTCRIDAGARAGTDVLPSSLDRQVHLRPPTDRDRRPHPRPHLMCHSCAIRRWAPGYWARPITSQCAAQRRAAVPCPRYAASCSTLARVQGQGDAPPQGRPSPVASHTHTRARTHDYEVMVLQRSWMVGIAGPRRLGMIEMDAVAPAYGHRSRTSTAPADPLLSPVTCSNGRTPQEEGGGTPPPLPLPMFEADSQNVCFGAFRGKRVYASKCLAPLRRGPQGYPRRRGGPSQTPLPLPSEPPLLPPSPPSNTSLAVPL